MNEVSFPGLGIGPFQISDIAIPNVFGNENINIRWYGILIAIGMVLAFCYSMRQAKKLKIKSDDILDLALYIVIFGVIGARLYYVIFDGGYIVTGGNFFENVWKSFLKIISIWEGGLAIFGGIIGGFLATVFVARKKKIRLPILLDILAPAVMIGQILGRWGNFFNCEAYGSETSLPWRMGITRTTAGGLSVSSIEVHPTFLYESVWNLIGLALILIFRKKKKFNGQVFYFYMMWYGLGRFFIEGLRTDSLLIAGNEYLRVSQLLAAAIFAAGLVLTIIFWRKASAAKKPVAEKAQAEETTEEAEKETESDTESAEDNGEKDNGSSD